LSGCITNSIDQVTSDFEDFEDLLDLRFVQVFAGFNQIDSVASGFLLESDVAVTAFHLVDPANIIYVYHPILNSFVKVSSMDFDIEDDLALLYLDDQLFETSIASSLEYNQRFSLGSNVIIRALNPRDSIQTNYSSITQVFQGANGDIIELNLRLENGDSGAGIISDTCHLIGVITNHTRRNLQRTYGITTHGISSILERGIFHSVSNLPIRFIRNFGTEDLPPRVEYYISLTAKSWISNPPTTNSSDQHPSFILEIKNNSNVSVQNLYYFIQLLDTSGNPIDSTEFSNSTLLRPTQTTLIQIQFRVS
jgi:hypothetical protein